MIYQRFLPVKIDSWSLTICKTLVLLQFFSKPPFFNTDEVSQTEKPQLVAQADVSSLNTVKLAQLFLSEALLPHWSQLKSNWSGSW